MSIVHEVESITNNEINSVKWDTLSGESINQYKEATDQKLRNVYIPTDALNCTNTSCCDESHRAELNALYNDVMQCMQDASTEVFSDSKVGEGGGHSRIPRHVRAPYYWRNRVISGLGTVSQGGP